MRPTPRRSTAGLADASKCYAVLSSHSLRRPHGTECTCVKCLCLDRALAVYSFLLKDLNNLCGTTERVQKAGSNKKVLRVRTRRQHKGKAISQDGHS